jgi:hypothetical protein
MEKKPVTPPSKFAQFCASMQGMNAIDENQREVPKFLLFWHYKYQTANEVSTRFELIDRPKNNKIL